MMENNHNKRSNSRGRFDSQYKARVVDIVHPKKWHMAKVRLVGYWADIKDEDLPWAEYQLPLGARLDEGEAMPVKKGDLVWVDFPQAGDTRYPKIIGGAYQVPNEEVHLPNDLFKPTFEHKRSDLQPDAPTAQYGDKTMDLFGLLQQLTMNGDYCLTHKSSGTAIHIDKDGNLVTHVEGEQFNSTTKNRTDEIGKKLKIIVKGTTTLESDGHVNVKAPTVDIGHEGLQPAVLGDDLKALLEQLIEIFNNHSHIGNMGSPTSPPQTLQKWLDCLSPTVKIRK